MYQKPDPNRVETSFRMFVQSNPTLFGSQPTDDFSQAAHGLAAATRNIPRDSTAYSAEPTQRDWRAHVNDQIKSGGTLP
jgi:hypothetical protein